MRSRIEVRRARRKDTHGNFRADVAICSDPRFQTLLEQYREDEEY
jgi:hypothetical protein